MAAWGYNSLALYDHICLRKTWSEPRDATGEAERWHWAVRRRAAVVSAFTVPSPALSSPGTKAWIVRTGWVFCFNTTKILTQDFVEMMQEKPCISSAVLHLFCSESTCVTLAGETRTLGFTTPRWCRQQTRSGHVVTVAVWEQSSCPCCCTHTSTSPPESNGFPLLQGQQQAPLPRSHLAWLSALLNHPGWLCRQSLPHPRTHSTYPRSNARKAPFSQAEGQFHTISQTSNW